MRILLYCVWIFSYYNKVLILPGCFGDLSDLDGVVEHLSHHEAQSGTVKESVLLKQDANNSKVKLLQVLTLRSA